MRAIMHGGVKQFSDGFGNVWVWVNKEGFFFSRNLISIRLFFYCNLSLNVTNKNKNISQSLTNTKLGKWNAVTICSLSVILFNKNVYCVFYLTPKNKFCLCTFASIFMSLHYFFPPYMDAMKKKKFTGEFFYL